MKWSPVSIGIFVFAQFFCIVVVAHVYGLVLHKPPLYTAGAIFTMTIIMLGMTTVLVFGSMLYEQRSKQK